jgi:hypothetical protein
LLEGSPIGWGANPSIAKHMRISMSGSHLDRHQMGIHTSALSRSRCKTNTVVPAVATKKCVRRYLAMAAETTYPFRRMTMGCASPCHAMQGAATTTHIVHRNNPISTTS